MTKKRLIAMFSVGALALVGSAPYFVSFLQIESSGLQERYLVGTGMIAGTCGLDQLKGRAYESASLASEKWVLIVIPYSSEAALQQINVLLQDSPRDFIASPWERHGPISGEYRLLVDPADESRMREHLADQLADKGG